MTARIHSRWSETKWSNLWSLALASPTTFIILVFFGYPLVLSFTRSFTANDAFPTTENYATVFASFHGDILYTVVVCVISLVAVLILSAAFAGLLRLVHMPVSEFLLMIPLFIPYVVVGHAMRIFLAPHGTLNSVLSYLPFYNADDIPDVFNGTAGLVAALVWKNLGLALLLVLGAFRSVSEDYLDAARNLGAGPLQLIVSFLIPMSNRTFGVVAILTSTSIFGNFSIPAMIGGSSTGSMLMIDLYDEINLHQDYGMANAIGTITYLLSAVAIWYYLRSIGGRSRSRSRDDRKER